jgi:hypothetical protein
LKCFCSKYINFGSYRRTSVKRYRGCPVPKRNHTNIKTDEMAEPSLCESWWAKILTSFEGRHAELLEAHPGCSEELTLTIKQIIHNSPPVNGNGAVWKELITRAEIERAVLYKHLDGKALFTANAAFIRCSP